jgi:tRNA(fMet)-specific endonuclease VapC
MLRYMLDTDICFYVISERPARLRGRFNRLEEQLCVSAITKGEMLYAAEKSERIDENLKTVEAFCAGLEVLPFGDRAAAHFGQLRATLRRKGTPIGPYDMLIGAHARSEGLTLVTDNTREFGRIDGLHVEGWE